VSEETANNLMPTGSQCGKLYGLCKVHKSDFPMRPVVSMIGTPEYQLAKFLDNLIKPNIPDTYMLNSTKDFIDRINFTNVKPNDIMVSLDVCSLFTNVPLTETINIITDYCFSNQAKLIPPVDKKIFKKLLKLATGGLFMYNGRLYKQIDGVAMGSPLGPTIANFFLANLEMEMFKKTNLIKPTVYLRYVDDVFAIFDCNDTLVNFFNFINKLHPNLKFTLERAKDTLPFLDVEVKIIGDYFETCVYRKKTHTNVLLNYNAMVPKKWKIGLIICLLNRAWCICSTSELFTTETAKLRKMFFDNNYPIRLFNQILEKFMANRNVVTEKSDEMNFRFILKIPYVGQPSFQFQKKMDILFKNKFNISIVCVYNSFKVGRYFTLKCRSPLPIQTNVVYKFTCLRDAELTYVGKTTRHLVTRVHEHLTFGNNKPSAIKDHILACSSCKNGNIDVANFEIVKKCSSDYDTSIMEALAIKKKNPKLNKQLFASGASFLLNIF
jgi:hypothetical protein